MAFKDYIILDEIGKGGFGEVFSVDKKGTIYALKLCSFTDQEHLNRFRREIKLMESVSHENVINIIDSDSANIPPYFVMPLCEGSLSNKNYNKNLNLLIDDILQVCNGLEALHNNSKSIIHRDIKPNNILVDGEVLKLSDLGLGKFEKRDTTPITPSDEMIGTAGYAPPEFYQIGGTKNATIPSDIYQLGKTIYSLYTNESPVFIDNKKVPSGLYYIIKKSTNENPADRYQSVDELKNALIRHLAVLNGVNNPFTLFDDLLANLQSRHVTKEDAYKLFDIIYEFKDDPDSFYSKVKKIPVDCFIYLNDGDLQTFLDVYNEVVLDLFNNGKLLWSDAETIAYQMLKVFNSTHNIMIRTNAMKITLFFASAFNRYKAMDVFNSLLISVKINEEAESVSTMLNDYLDQYACIVLQKDQATNLHPYIQEIRYNIIRRNKM